MKILRQIIFSVITLLGAGAALAQSASNQTCRANYIYVQGASNKVAFLNKSDCDYSASEWSFGDGQVVTSKNAVHEYNSPGYYLLRLVVVNDQQKGDTLYQIIKIQNSSEPYSSYANTDESDESSFALSARSKDALFECFDKFFADAVLVSSAKAEQKQKKKVVEDSW